MDESRSRVKLLTWLVLAARRLRAWQPLLCRNAPSRSPFADAAEKLLSMLGGPDEREQTIIDRAERLALGWDEPKDQRNPAPHTVPSTPRSFSLFHPIAGDSVALQIDQTTWLGAENAIAELLLDTAGSTSSSLGARFLALWRRLPELEGRAAALANLPVSPSVLNVSLWRFLSLACAFAGALHTQPNASDTPALLVVALGPVQGFIAQARKSTDLWAGSHLLSYLAWESMRPLVEQLGPDAVISPDLTGLPSLDLWLLSQLDATSTTAAWLRDRTTRLAQEASGSLFAPAIPNRFMAIVARTHAQTLSEALKQSAQTAVCRHAETAWQEVLRVAGARGRAREGLEQLQAQLAGFPEVHWAVACCPPCDRDAPASPHWYATVHETVERTLAAAKATRCFHQLPQHGYRCSLCGEREWLCLERTDLERHARQVAPWAKVAEQRPGWAREGERLCALCCLKRLWPTLYRDELTTNHKQLFHAPIHASPAVSTHAMAIASTLERLLSLAEPKGERFDLALLERLRDMLDQLRAEFSLAPLVLAPSLVGELKRLSTSDPTRAATLAHVAHWLPAAIDALDEASNSTRVRAEAQALAQRRRQLEQLVKQATGAPLERYYALVLMDGDRMGAWLSGRGACAGEKGNVSHSATGLPNPAYHAAISAALNTFSLSLAPTLVESVFLGKLLYAGGDDLLAMLGLTELIPAVWALRAAYSGLDPKPPLTGIEQRRFAQRFPCRLEGGWAIAQKAGVRRPTMGPFATASAGVVIAHHTAPLAAVLRALRAAERRAKTQARRDAFSVTLIKRSGGISALSAGWLLEHGAKAPAIVLERLRRALATRLSRQTTYLVLEWLSGIEPTPIEAAQTDERETHKALLHAGIARQFLRQRRNVEKHEKHQTACDNGEDLITLARDLVEAAYLEADRRASRTNGAVHDRESAFRVVEWLCGMFTVAEFLARESRSPAAQPLFAGTPATR